MQMIYSTAQAQIDLEAIMDLMIKRIYPREMYEERISQKNNIHERIQKFYSIDL